MVLSSCSQKNGKLIETTQVSVLWSNYISGVQMFFGGSSLKATHNQSQRFQNQIVYFLFSIQVCSMNPTLYTVEL